MNITFTRLKVNYLVSSRKQHLVQDDLWFTISCDTQSEFTWYPIITEVVAFTYPSGGELPLAGPGSFLLVRFRYLRRTGNWGRWETATFMRYLSHNFLHASSPGVDPQYKLNDTTHQTPYDVCLSVCSCLMPNCLSCHPNWFLNLHKLSLTATPPFTISVKAYKRHIFVVPVVFCENFFICPVWFFCATHQITGLNG